MADPQFADPDRRAQQNHPGFGQANKDAMAAAGSYHAGPYQGHGTGFGDTDPYTDPTDFMWGGYAEGADDARAQYAQAASAAAARQGPQMDTSGWSYARGLDERSADAQRSVASAYGAMAAGNGPTVAGAQSDPQRDAIIAAQLGAAQGNPYASTLGAVGQLGAHNAQMGSARGQEVAGAMQGQAGVQGQIASGDMQRLGFSQQAATRQAGLDLQQRAQNDAMVRQYGDLSYGVRAAQLKAAQQFESQEGYSRLADMGLLNGAQQARQVANQQQQAAMYGAMATVGAGMADQYARSAASGPDYQFAED